MVDFEGLFKDLELFFNVLMDVILGWRGVERGKEKDILLVM